MRSTPSELSCRLREGDLSFNVEMPWPPWLDCLVVQAPGTGNGKRRGHRAPAALRSTSTKLALVDPGRPVAEERGEQAKQENEQDKTNSHTGPSLPLGGQPGRPEC